MNRKLIFLTISFIFQLNAFSQYNKGKLYVDANYRYNNKNQMSIGLGSKKINSLLTSNIGYFILKNFVVGVGLNFDYTKSATTIQGMQMLTMDGELVYNEHITNSSIMTGFSPAVFIKYIYPFTSNLSISLMVRSSAGNLKEDVSVQSIDVVDGSSNPPIIKSANGKYSSILLSPEIRYIITKNIGLQINFNGYEISSFPKENSMFDYTRFGGYVTKEPITYDKSTRINFNPSNWSFGVFVVL